MKFNFHNKFFFVFIIINFLSIVNNQIANCTNSTCIVIILYYNGTIIRKCTDDFSLNEIGSIGLTDKIILYDCNKDSNSNCKLNRNPMDNSENCLEISTKNSNSFCCRLKEEYYENETKINDTNSCVEVDKNEYERFKTINYSLGYIEKNFKNNNQTFGSLLCFDKFQKFCFYNYIIIFIFFSFILF